MHPSLLGPAAGLGGPSTQPAVNSLLQWSASYLIDSGHDSKNSGITHDSSFNVLFRQSDSHFMTLKRGRIQLVSWTQLLQRSSRDISTRFLSELQKQ